MGHSALPYPRRLPTGKALTIWNGRFCFFFSGCRGIEIRVRGPTPTKKKYSSKSRVFAYENPLRSSRLFPTAKNVFSLSVDLFHKGKKEMDGQLNCNINNKQH
nr:hypothetical protein [Trentepohlia sp. YN1317]